MKKIGLGLLFGVVVLALILTINTLRLPALPASEARTPVPLPQLDAAANRLAAAVRVQTVSYGFASPPGGNQFPVFHKLLEESFPLLHASLKKEVINDASLLFTWQGSDPSLPPILLTAHQDVVPIEPGTESKWEHPPFAGDIADGFVWGRGAQDDKHRLMATLEAVERLLAEGVKPKRSIYLAFGHDEELGGRLGAKMITDLLEQRKVRMQWSLDEGSLIAVDAIPGVTRPLAQIGVSEKGGLTLQLVAKGKAGHSSMPPPVGAIGRLGRAVAKLEDKQMPASLDGPGGDTLRALAPAMPLLNRVVIANTWLFGPLLERQLSKAGLTNALIRTTTAPTMVQGGVKDNVMPGEASAVVNFRLAPGDSVESVKAHATRVIGDDEITISDYRGNGAPATPVADKSGPGFKLLSEVIRELAPEAVIAPGLVVVGTDSKHYGRISENAYRFSPVRATPGDLARIHATNERISIANYGELIGFYMALLKKSAL